MEFEIRSLTNGCSFAGLAFGTLRTAGQIMNAETSGRRGLSAHLCTAGNSLVDLRIKSGSGRLRIRPKNFVGLIIQVLLEKRV